MSTSLIEGEGKPKHSFRLQVDGVKYTLDPIVLQRQRPLLYRHVELAKTKLPPGRKHLQENFIKGEVQKLLDDYDKQLALKMTSEMFTDMNADYIKLPLVRIRIDYSGGYEALSLTKFGKEFDGLLANPRNFLSFYKLRTRQEMLRKKQADNDGFMSKCKVTGGEA